MAFPTYNQVIRKIVLAFGDLFSNITLVRYTENLTEVERFPVPIVYGAKENYVMRLEGDPTLDRKVLMTLPIMSYEMHGVKYNPKRKLNTNIQNFGQTASGIISQYNPVPYDFDFSLVIYVRNIEDGSQIVEHILPFFTPDYTIAVNLVPDMGSAGIRQLPITLNDARSDVDYEGNRNSDPRMVLWTLDFTVQGFIFPAINGLGSNGIIYNAITNITSIVNSNSPITFNMSTTGIGTYQIGEMVYQGYPGYNIATGVVTSYINNQLLVTNVLGNFTIDRPIIGLTTGASHPITSFGQTPVQFAQIITSPIATDSTANTVLGYTTTINEPPNIANTIITTTDFSGDVMFEYGVDDLMTESENVTDLGP